MVGEPQPLEQLMVLLAKSGKQTSELVVGSEREKLS
jgi:hypothetical protein